MPSHGFVSVACPCLHFDASRRALQAFIAPVVVPVGRECCYSAFRRLTTDQKVRSSSLFGCATFKALQLNKLQGLLLAHEATLKCHSMHGNAPNYRFYCTNCCALLGKSSPTTINIRRSPIDGVRGAVHSLVLKRLPLGSGSNLRFVDRSDSAGTSHVGRGGRASAINPPHRHSRTTNCRHLR